MAKSPLTSRSRAREPKLIPTRSIKSLSSQVFKTENEHQRHQLAEDLLQPVCFSFIRMRVHIKLSITRSLGHQRLTKANTQQNRDRQTKSLEKEFVNTVTYTIQYSTRPAIKPRELEALALKWGQLHGVSRYHAGFCV